MIGNHLLSKERYERLVHQFAACRVLVVGDIMADEYLRGQVRRISPESPVMIVEVQKEEIKPGGAANVANNLHALGAKVYLAGFIGEDEIGKNLVDTIQEAGIYINAVLVDPSRPTTRKTRIIAQHQQVLRVDRERTHEAPLPLQEQLALQVGESLHQVDAVVLSDYRKGALSPHTISTIMASAKRFSLPVIANPKPASAHWFSGATVLSLNQAETEELAGPIPLQDHELATYGAQLRAQLQVDILVTTLGPRGLAYWCKSGEHCHVPAHAIEVYDVAGAGDTTISAFTLALLCGATPLEAACIANHAGACAVRKVGVATVSPEELLDDWDQR
ncbi:ADP-heptose synthase, bifunctional sugar kinase/adenylyltransferase [Chthonomonas calidirosea]|uniref:ADP-heptose synthase, bifunctional sugar kinase/adenylyltransferase n=1 Tax=Chthonomonas calidirosea (strain DSM 23976 / ICMP 18418 / T49) TaxID=1303518 RepID=S0F056_CHTCT|nr:PfkB family carbohydrate kinase [Chthonomonas calidirosea]CCW36538.1 ADP-heptose synthase, bifunctional sugar kinase/adenylyltransferase [Chthonomonas calidirosea T49]CEK15936.1 ADP-heptose synthase, bifunctional sugar kinase/adenylyltransferase [Chthonomonas calidirosea]CEK15943.1 ADP-heptose synthase, bifunctional sugar kinase/adenylyltransferase [Chthonomonas calidirosea]CEK17037.1 ADP-heptose synthase, bifunctional sugar kinase/adenylyltransferase [Chthonomonas calidirosea]